MPTRRGGSALKNASMAVPQFLLNDDLLAGVDPVNLKHVLGDIQIRTTWNADATPQTFLFGFLLTARAFQPRAPDQVLAPMIIL